MVSPFQHCPKRLNAVRVGHAVYVLIDAVLVGLVGIRDAPGRLMFVGVDRRIVSGPVYRETVQSVAVRTGDDASGDLVGLTVSGSGNDRLADGTAANVQPLAGVFVAFLTAYERFINFNRPLK